VPAQPLGMRVITLSSLFVLGCSAPASRGLGLDYLVPGAASSDSRTGLGALDRALSTTMQNSYRAELAAAPPISLVPSDGSELQLKSLDALVAINGPLAYTELKFKFHNAEARQREGRFTIALPPGATVGKLKMKVAGVWRESRVISRHRGREVYEGFLHRKVDPALLERDLGNQFSARIFPIAPNEDKEIVIAYEHLVSASEPYRLGLAGMPLIPSLSIAIDHDGQARSIDSSGRLPADLVIAIAPGSDALAAGDAFVARIEAPSSTAEASIEKTLFLVDTSASRATVMAKQTELLAAVLRQLPERSTVAIATFDHRVSEMFHGFAAEAHVSVPAILEYGALGGSDLGQALERAAASGMRRVVIIGDGAPTLGETEAAKLAAIVKDSKIERVDAIQVGQSVDRDTLAIVVAAGQVPGAILVGRDPTQVARQLTAKLAEPRAIRVAGAKTWPATTAGVAPGDPIYGFGLRSEAASEPLTMSVGSQRFSVTPRRGDSREVRRAVAGAELAALGTELQLAKSDARGKLAQQIEALALEHQLVSPMTSLIVLETDADEARVFGGSAPATSEFNQAGEVISIAGSAPIIDQATTRTGITLTQEFTRNIPTGRTFSAVLGSAAGAQVDGYGISISGATSHENLYIVDGVNTSSMRTSRQLTISSGMWGQSSRLTQDLIADAIKSNAFAFSDPIYDSSGSTPTTVKRPPSVAAYNGRMRDVMVALHAGQRDRALALATKWQLANPGEVAAILALGEALEARGADALASRAYGSLVDLYPNRVELVRLAGERLERIASRLPATRKLAIDAYRRALKERPDHATTYRLLAFALVRDDRGDEALDLLVKASQRGDRQWGVTEALAGDALFIAAHLVAQNPGRRAALHEKLGQSVPTHASMRIVLSWESDASDLDLYVTDKNGNIGSGYYGLPSGGATLANISDGYGPEVFAVDHPSAFPYRLAVSLVNKGPAGIAAGSVQIIRHDGAGNLTVEDRPFVIQEQSGVVDLGTITR
jgi:hypothetical protein